MITKEMQLGAEIVKLNNDINKRINAINRLENNAGEYAYIIRQVEERNLNTVESVLNFLKSGMGTQAFMIEEYKKEIRNLKNLKKRFENEYFIEQRKGFEKLGVNFKKGDGENDKLQN